MRVIVNEDPMEVAIKITAQKGPNYIRSNQSFLYRKNKNQRKTQEKLSAIVEKLTSVLQYRFHIPPKSSIIQQLSNHLERIFYQQYTTSLSYLDIYRIRKDIKLVHSIKRKLRKAHCILRMSDKSGVFRIGRTIDYNKKVEKYQKDTDAYIELSSNPLMETFEKVVRLLNDLHTKRQITARQHKRMMPDKKKIKLAYLYFIPKPHKLKINRVQVNYMVDKYIDDIFLTSNDSIETLKQMLEDANEKHPNIALTYEIGNRISFVDLQIKNQEENLITPVHHKEAAEPYVVPFKSDHPRHIFENIIRTILLRAVRYCSTLEEFNHERRAIKLMLLYNG
ncbi:unnamed protein product [Didymodactylos carnosus]|uniref:Helix-turn-helix domain-containing protein n=1 Tax=Didymodactylos carnosus TaxID=1234261 RepID=A0A815HF01_9BILA|nr:unnamed protein product [Didymodactylos carnosus]CAF4219106.1 unnamed protein product [Didymodactylos carnosus]